MTEENRIKIPKVLEHCIWCGACLAIAWDVFEFNEEWKAYVKSWMNSSNSESIDDSITACPVEAIVYED
jgi:ferredoxin